LWISFILPKTENYAGLNYRLTMDDGSVHKGVFDVNNKIYLPSVSARFCISVEIENLGKNDEGMAESMTGQLLKDIMG